MASISVKLTSNRDLIESASNEAIARALEAVGLQAEGYAKMLCPVDTGNLRNSITHEVDSGEHAVQVGTNVEYAAYVEYGTSKTTAQPYLEPAITNNADQYEEMIKYYLENA